MKKSTYVLLANAETQQFAECNTFVMNYRYYVLSLEILLYDTQRDRNLPRENLIEK